MRIALCYPIIPFMRGGAEKHVETLYHELVKRNHQVEFIKIPFKWYPPMKILDSILTWKLLDITESNGEKIDLVISTKFPSYVVDHPNHVTWLFHQHRPAYDLKDTEFDDLKDYPDGEYVRKKIMQIDNKSLNNVKKLFTNSKNTSNRLLKYNKIQSEPLYFPVPNYSKFHNEEYGDYVLYPSRISPLKRQDLLIEAMKFTKTDVKCVVTGYESHENWLKEKINDDKVRNKVDLRIGLSDEEIIDLYSKALAVVYVPQDEDLGLVTLEAFHSEKNENVVEDLPQVPLANRQKISEEALDVTQLELKDITLAAKALRGIRKYLHRDIRYWVVFPFQKKQTYFNRKSVQNFSQAFNEIDYQSERIDVNTKTIENVQKNLESSKNEIDQKLDATNSEVKQRLDSSSSDLNQKT